MAVGQHLRGFRWAAAIVVLLGLAGPGQSQSLPILEASGISRDGESLLIVDDSWRGAYFRFPLDGERGPVILLDPKRLQRVPLPQANMATDLEAIDVLADGRVVVLSERLRALFGHDGLVADYDAAFAEFGKRGLEGLAVRETANQSSRVAVLWEGGYPEYRFVPEQLRPRVGRLALLPIVQTHSLQEGEYGVLIRGSNYVRLDVPVPPGRGPQAQRFRAPDLVWHRQPDGSWGYIALLSSQNSADEPVFLHHWLQRFSLQGERIGAPVDLDRIVPEDLRGVNWEGLGWFQNDESLVMVHESHPRPDAVAYVLELPEDWKFRPPSASEFTHWIDEETEYYLSGPQQSRPPDGKLQAGTKVKILQGAQSYCLVRTDADLVVYIETGHLKPYVGE